MLSFRILAARITELECCIKTLELSGLGTRLGENEGEETQQLWHDRLEEDDHSRDKQTAEQLMENLSLSGAKKLATDSACHVEIA